MASVIQKQDEPSESRTNQVVQDVQKRIALKCKTVNPPTGIATYVPRKDDVLITSFPKSGTTLMQQLTYQVVVATGGAPPEDPTGTNFIDIAQPVPWLEFLPEFHANPKSSEFPIYEPSPRLYKTHASADRFDVRANTHKHIVITRDPEKVACSSIAFSCDVFGIELDQYGKDTIPVQQGLFDSNTRRNIIGEGDIGPWVRYVKGWMEMAKLPNVLFLTYEDVISDFEGTIKAVAKFMGRKISEDGVKAVVSRCSKQYMIESGQFQTKCEPLFLPVSPTAAKVKKGDKLGFKQFRVMEQDAINLSEQMKRHLGVSNYGELRQSISALT